ncbi:hypothetical protein EC844_101319 [Acinetobacter calcoaceticus]|uniref:Lipoprotein n=1 Tax=Acinetobacter calcoaceticus TaxID=471 RepID=A0A4V2R249_ACICA|nr:hypothetical protein EC844_101319 [Acinetobacter calcoaceticus]
MKNNVFLSLIIFTLFTTACSSSPPMWQKNNINSYETNSVLAKCRYDVGMAKFNQVEKIELVNDCMTAQGFRHY